MDSNPANASQAVQRPRRSRSRLLWALGGALLATLLVIAAIIVIPRVLHAQRVATYTGLVSQTNIALGEAHRVDRLADQGTVHYALQLGEAREFQSVLENLAGYSDHYFSEDNLAALADANEALKHATTEDGLDESETQLANLAKDAIETHGYAWQTDFLNLTPDAVEDVLEHSEPSLVEPVADAEVTDVTIEEARDALRAAEAQRLQSESKLAASESRGLSLVEAVAASLDSLQRSALGAPEQAAVVIGMYPNADERSTSQLNGSAELAFESVSAASFTFDEDYKPIPLSTGAEPDGVTVTATDAWRAVIIATHLADYSEGITAAWITDAGGIEQALGFNPYLPFFPF